MKYDTTSGGTRNEWKSLGVLGIVLVLGAGAMSGAVYLARMTGIGAGWSGEGAGLPHATGFVNRLSENYALVRGGDTYVNIYARGNEMSVKRAAPQGVAKAGEDWNLARMVQRVVSNPEVARMCGVTEEVPALRALNLQMPALSPAQQSKLGILFLQAQDAGEEERKGMDQLLIDNVASVGVSKGDEAAFDAAVEKVKIILTPEQVEWVRNGRRPPSPASRSAAVTTRPAK